MTARALVLVCTLLSGCSLVLVRDLDGTAVTDRKVALSCTTSRAMPTADFVLGAAMASAVAAVTYAAVEHFNEMCVGECYHAWKPTTLAAFLTVSPWWISSAVGFSDTGKCREAYRARGITIE